MATKVPIVVTFGGRIVKEVPESDDVLEDGEPETPVEAHEEPVEQPESPPPTQPPVPNPDENDATEKDSGPGGVGGPSNPHHPGIPIHPKQGEAPAGTFPCRKCGAWQRTNGQPFTEHGRTVHERMAHKGNKGEGKMAKKKQKAKSKPQKPQDPPDHDDPDIRFAGPGAEERERRNRLDDILYTYERFIKVDEKEYIMRVWDSDEMVRNDPRALADLLRTLEPMRKNPNILDRIIAATWGRAFGTSPEPPSAYSHYSRQGYGQGGSEYPQSGHYGQQGHGYGPRGPMPGQQRMFTPQEMEEERRKAYEEASKDQEIREQAERIKVLEERSKNPPLPPQPPLTAENIATAVATAIEKNKADPEDSELLKEMRKQNDLMEKQLADRDKDKAVRDAVKGVEDKLAPELSALRKDRDAEKREADLKKVAEDAAKNVTPSRAGVSDETSLILDDNKTTREVMLKVVDKVADVGEKAFATRQAASQPINTHQGQTEGLTAEQEKELREKLGPDFVD